MSTRPYFTTIRIDSLDLFPLNVLKILNERNEIEINALRFLSIVSHFMLSIRSHMSQAHFLLFYDEPYNML